MEHAVRFDSKAEGGVDGPDGERYYNYVRLVRGGNIVKTPDGDPTTLKANRVIKFKDGDTGGRGQGRPGGFGAPGRKARGAGEPGGRPDFAAAAATLGISEEALVKALGKPTQGPPDFEAAAASLGITTGDLEAALIDKSRSSK